jgi:hypothetical protein
VISATYVRRLRENQGSGDRGGMHSPCCDSPTIVWAEDDYQIISACRNCGTVQPSPVKTRTDGELSQSQVANSLY